MVKITGPGLPPQKGAATPPETAVVSGQMPVQKDSSLTPAARLTRLFADRNISLPSSQIRALAAELLALGFDASELTGDTALRALLLHRHNIPLTSELIDYSFDGARMIFGDIGVLHDHARMLLADFNLSPLNKQTVDSLTRTLTNILQGNVSPESLRFALEDVVDLWGHEVESRLVALLKSGAIEGADGYGGKQGSVGKEIESLLAAGLQSRNDGEADSLVSALRSAVSALRAQIQAGDPGRAAAAAVVRTMVASLGSRLAEAVGEFVATGDTGAVQVAGMIGEFLEKQVQILEDRLLVHLPVDSAEGPDLLPEGALDAARIGNIIRKGGMAFEWQILAWYRSGRTPGRLAALVNGDLKGGLIEFLNRIKRNREKGAARRNITRLEQESRTLLERITNRQVTNILNEHSGQRGYHFELPLAVEPEKGSARILVHDRKDQNERLPGKRDITLSFQIETSNIGRVDVLLTTSEKNVSLHFLFESESDVELGREMSGEIREAFLVRGYTVGSIVCSHRDNHGESEEHRIGKKKSLDVRR